MNAIRLENVSKKFDLTHQRDKTGKSFFSSFPGQKMVTEYWALKEINFEIEKGKVVGIIGRNGAGKSTLLNMIAGISPATMGEIKTEGQVSSMLTLGAGFQDELTGRENIYLNSSILNINRQEVNKKYQSIVEFSELGGFLDYPLKAYSQGMRLRLGFSMVIHMDFDILLIDEIFSVGDVSFQKKCFNQMEEFKKEGKTMLIASQSLDVIDRFCDEVILLENGEIVQQGAPQKAIAQYLELLNKNKLSETFRQRYCVSKWWADKRFWGKKEGSRETRIINVETYDAKGKPTNKFKTKEAITVKVHFIADNEIEEPHFGVAIFREDGVYCYGPNTIVDGHRIDKLNAGEGFFDIKYKSLCLQPGEYRFSIAIWDKNELWAYDYHAGYYKFEIVGQNNNAQLLNLEHKWEPDQKWLGARIFNPREQSTFLNLSRQIQDKIPACDIEITSAGLSDSSGSPKDTFNTGEDLKINLQFKFLKDRKDYYLWVGLFRIDDVYCHGSTKKLNEETLSLTYPKIPLLNGDYYLSAGVWLKDHSEPILYRHGVCNFKISSLGQDHGTIYLEHSWDWKLP